MNDSRTYDRWDVGMLIFSLAGIFLSLSGGLAFAGIAIMSGLQGNLASAQSAEWSSAGILFASALGLPALIGSARALLTASDVQQPSKPSRTCYAVLLLFPVGLLLSYLAYEQSIFSSLFGPVGQLLAIGAPAAGVVVAVRRSGPATRPRRAWGHFLVGLWAVPLAALLAEAILLVGTIAAGMIALLTTVQGRTLAGELQQLLQPTNPMTQPISPDLLAQVALQPAILILVFLFLSVGVPAIEEGMKTAAIWPLLSRRLTSGEAFLGGAIGGTGFALSEAILVTQPMAGWLPTVVSRAGATMMHALATGIAAWGVAEAIGQRRWRRGALAFLSAMALHGIWNAGALSIGVGEMSKEFNLGPPIDANALAAVGIGLIVVLSLLAFMALPILQRRATAGRAKPETEPEEEGTVAAGERQA
ncbi:MAG: PrsW family glutamic-type intramembrane protease [Anaerolineales bacterium]